MMRELAADRTEVWESAEVRDRRGRRRARAKRTVIIAAAGSLVLTLVAAAAVFYYWTTRTGTPEYSLALLVDAARRDDRATVDTLIDTNAVVADFVPQVTDKAVEIYGRGVSPKVIAQARRLAKPVLPALSERIRRELPRVIAERTAAFKHVPFPLLVLGAGSYVAVAREGDTATVSVKDSERRTEVVLKRTGEYWTIVKLRDPELATEIAQVVGEEMLRIAARPDVEDVTDLMRSAEAVLTGSGRNE